MRLIHKLMHRRTRGENRPTEQADSNESVPSSSLQPAMIPEGSLNQRYPLRDLEAPTQPIPQGVFISYARADEEFVLRFRNDLHSRHFPVWIDTESLIPGVPDFEKVIREAIPNSYSLLLIATPLSKDSPYVKGEIAKARAVDCPVIPIWAAGDTWVNSAPLSLADAQYVDCRGTNYAHGLNRLVHVLEDIVARRAPRQFKLQLVAPGENSAHADEITIPPGYTPLPVGGSAVVLVPSGYLVVRVSTDQYTALRLSAFPSYLDLLHELYMAWLDDRYPPFSYGQRWVLQSAIAEHGHSFVRHLLMPAEWISNPKLQEETLLLATFGDQLSFKKLGIVEKSLWEVIDGVPPSGTAIGVVTNSEKFADAVRGIATHVQRASAYLKALHFRIRRLLDSAQSATPAAIRLDEYAYSFVLIYPHGFSKYLGKVVVFSEPNDVT